MEKLLKNVTSYFEYLRKECHLFCSVHFSAESCRRIPSGLIREIAPYMIHSHPYCRFVKESGRQILCMQNQKDILAALEGKERAVHTCHGGVLEILYPIRCEEKSIRGFVAVSGYQADGDNSAWIEVPLYSALSPDRPDEALTDTLIPPLCMMLERITALSSDEDEGEFKLLLSYLAENHTHVTLDALAAHFGRSRSHISHLFKANAGVSLRAYCNDLRLCDAKGLLQSTSLSVTEVAYEVGFDDASYFIKLFREKYGISPLKFKGLL